MRGCQPLSFEQFDLVLNTFSGRSALRDRLLFVLGATTGFRISELLSLSVASVWSAGKPNKFVAVPRGAMKGRRESRSVPLPAAVHPFLRAWVAELALRGALSPACPLFLSRKALGSPCPPRVSFFSRILHTGNSPNSIGQKFDTSVRNGRPGIPASTEVAKPRAISRVQAHRIISAALVQAVGVRPCNGTHTMRKTFAARVFAACDQNVFLLQQALAHASPASTVAYLDGCSDQVNAAIAAAALPPNESPQQRKE